MRPKKRGGKVLVVEDDRGMRALTSRAASHLNLDVVAVETISEARQVMMEEAFDGIVVDYFLPDGTGGQLIRELQEQLGPHRPPAVLVTATPESVSEDERELFLAMLTKPFRLSELYEHLEEIRQQRRRARSGVVLKGGRPAARHRDKSGTED